MGGETILVKCQRCKDPFHARVADRKRGWGKFCSKSCKAIRQAYGKDAYRSTMPATVGQTREIPEWLEAELTHEKNLRDTATIDDEWR